MFGIFNFDEKPLKTEERDCDNSEKPSLAVEFAQVEAAEVAQVKAREAEYTKKIKELTKEYVDSPEENIKSKIVKFLRIHPDRISTFTDEVRFIAEENENHDEDLSGANSKIAIGLIEPIITALVKAGAYRTEDEIAG